MNPASEPAAPASGVPTPQASRRACPRCGSTRVYRSHRRGFTERALSLAGLKVRRCHTSNLRFARLGSSAIWMEDAARVVRKLIQWAVLLIGGALILRLVMWLSARQAS